MSRKERQAGGREGGRGHREPGTFAVVGERATAEARY
jgi:hypothetical protein